MNELAILGISDNMPWIIGGGIALGFFAISGWVFNTWLRVHNGYPLENSWGKAVYPQKNEDVVERIKLLSQENAQLRAEMGAIKDRLINVERIVTDGALRLNHEIESLRGSTN